MAAVGLLISVAVSTPVFAADARTVQVKGYLWEEMTAEDMAAARTQLEISNVTAALDLKEGTKIVGMSGAEAILASNASDMDGAYIADSPVTIKNIDAGSIFEVYKLKIDGNEYKYDLHEALPFTSGKVELYGADVITVDVSEMSNYSYDEPYYLNGCTVSLTEPGDYYAIFRYPAEADAAEVFITVEGKADAAVLKASPTASKVLVNGTVTSFDAYTIEGNNYFKLRDLAYVVSGSGKQFEVTWDGERKAINLISNKAYTTVGGEMAIGDGKEKTPVVNTSMIYKDGAVVPLTAYTINENNYFKLRDIAQAFDIGVTWDGATNTVGIDTTISYVAP